MSFVLLESVLVYLLLPAYAPYPMISSTSLFYISLFPGSADNLVAPHPVISLSQSAFLVVQVCPHTEDPGVIRWGFRALARAMVPW